MSLAGVPNEFSRTLEEGDVYENHPLLCIGFACFHYFGVPLLFE
jgi:hypothetical protein